LLKTLFFIGFLSFGAAICQGQQQTQWPLAQASEVFTFDISPNPLTQNPLHISSSRSEVKEIHIYNAIGHLVYTEKTSAQKVYLNHLQKGIYVVTIQQGNFRASRRLIIP